MEKNRSRLGRLCYLILIKNLICLPLLFLQFEETVKADSSEFQDSKPSECAHYLLLNKLVL